MKKLCFLLLAFGTFGLQSCSKDDEFENPPVIKPISGYVQENYGTKFTIQSAVMKLTKNSTENTCTVTFVSADNGVTRTMKLVQKFALTDKLAGGYSTTSIRLLDPATTSFKNDAGEFTNLSQGSSNITVNDSASNNYTVTFSYVPENGETIYGTYSGVFTMQ